MNKNIHPTSPGLSRMLSLKVKSTSSWYWRGDKLVARGILSTDIPVFEEEQLNTLLLQKIMSQSDVAYLLRKVGVFGNTWLGVIKIGKKKYQFTHEDLSEVLGMLLYWLVR